VQRDARRVEVKSPKGFKVSKRLHCGYIAVEMKRVFMGLGERGPDR